jgi:hypothetical protein
VSPIPPFATVGTVPFSAPLFSREHHGFFESEILASRKFRLNPKISLSKKAWVQRTQARSNHFCAWQLYYNGTNDDLWAGRALNDGKWHHVTLLSSEPAVEESTLSHPTRGVNPESSLVTIPGHDTVEASSVVFTQNAHEKSPEALSTLALGAERYCWLGLLKASACPILPMTRAVEVAMLVEVALLP